MREVAERSTGTPAISAIAGLRQVAARRCVRNSRGYSAARRAATIWSAVLPVNSAM
jgi:hypothetical protein